MTEAEWLKTGDAWKMLSFVCDVGGKASLMKSSRRKVRLFACGSCRAFRRFDLSNDEVSEDTISLIEHYVDRFADGQITARKLESILREADIYHPGLVESAFLLARDCVSPRFEDPTSWEKQTQLFRDIFGNPFRPVAIDASWLTPTAVAIAQGIYADRTFDRLPILADALQDAGCENADILTHLRSDGPHVKGCWALDLVLGKE